MEVILLEKITKLGDPGDLVNVKSGYARNYLIPFSKAIKANEENKAEYEQRKSSLEKAELERKSLLEDIEDVKQANHEQLIVRNDQKLELMDKLQQDKEKLNQEFYLCFLLLLI